MTKKNKNTANILWICRYVKPVNFSPKTCACVSVCPLPSRRCTFILFLLMKFLYLMESVGIFTSHTKKPFPITKIHSGFQLFLKKCVGKRSCCLTFDMECHWIYLRSQIFDVLIYLWWYSSSFHEEDEL